VNKLVSNADYVFYMLTSDVNGQTTNWRHKYFDILMSDQLQQYEEKVNDQQSR